MNAGNLAKIYIIANKIVSQFLVAWERKNAGGKMKVTSIMLLKTSVEKMPDFRLSIMLLIINTL